MSIDSLQLSIRYPKAPMLANRFATRGMRALDAIEKKEAISEPLETLSLTNSIGMRLGHISAGSFQMGNPRSQTSPFLSETQHTTTLTQDFYIGCFQVTQGQYQKVIRENPSCFRGKRNNKDTADFPVENVSWYQAYAFCLFLSALPEEREAGRVYRLPTEAQWEYACRAGSTTAYCFGDDMMMLDKYARHGSNSRASTVAVGQKRPNAWGLYDMHGNVLEWCADWYGPYPSEACVAPVGPDKGYGRVFRGGAYDFNPELCGAAFRSMNHPTYRMNNLGFRVAMECL